MFFLIIPKDTLKKRDEQQKSKIFLKDFEPRNFRKSLFPLPINF